MQLKNIERIVRHVGGIIVRRRGFVLLLFLALQPCVGLLYAQVKLDVERDDALYSEAYSFYQAGLYAAAESAFAHVLEVTPADGNSRRADAMYYKALCALRLGRKDGEYRLARFLEEYSESPHVVGALLELGLLHFRAEDWPAAAEQLEQVDALTLDAEGAAERDFKLGYAYFRQGNNDEALACFARVRDTKTYYYAHSTYFYAHIAYSQGNYSTALEEFSRIADDSSFAPIISYYVAQIYYKQGEYEKVVECVPSRIDGAAESRKAELLRLLGDSQYRLGHDSASLATWQRYIVTTDAVTREENYVVGMVNYRLANYAAASQHLEKVATEDDAYTQNANYYLGDCYLREGDKARARAAFEMASQSMYDSMLREDALFTYAKLTFELQGSSLADAVDAFTRYLTAYPHSPRASEAYNYLGMAYASTKNYQKALDALQKVPHPDMLTQQAMQRAAYYRGVELYQNLRYALADSLFAFSLSIGSYVPELRASALYWRGESLYRMQQYALAAKQYRDYRGVARAFTQEEYVRSAYNLGYCQFKMHNYRDAGEWFRQYVSSDVTRESNDMVTDAYCRLGDCHYVGREYWPAIEAYDKSVQLGGIGADYALFQEGFSYGLVERPLRKVEILRKFDAEYVSSPRRPEAFYELGVTLQSLDSLNMARRYYERIVSDYPTSDKASSALVQLGLVAYAREENEKAQEYLKRVVKDYPKTPQADEALLALERVYKAAGNVKGYFSYLESIGVEQQYSQTQRDSIIYSEAVDLYFRGQYQRATRALQTYIDEYPRGNYTLPAQFYLAESLCSQRDSLHAVPHLQNVVAIPSHKWRERALQLLSEAYENSGDWQRALGIYTDLEVAASSVEMLIVARAGRLRMAVAVHNIANVIESANSLLSTEKLQPELSLYANFQLGGALLASDRLDEAYAAYSRLGTSTGSAVGAEACYQKALIRYRQRNMEAVREEVTNFARQNTPHQYWLGKAFILLAKVYGGKGDFFQAKATLQSILDNYATQGDGVIEEATREMALLVESEKSKQRAEQGDTIQFEFQK